MSPSANAPAAASVPVKRLFKGGVLSGCVVYISPEINISTGDHIDISPARVSNLGATISTDPHAVNLTHIVSSVSLFSSAPDVVFVKPSFLTACESIDVDIDGIARAHRLRTLEGLEIVPSNLRMNVKSQLEALSKVHGAEFIKSLAGTCTHLVTPAPSGKKFEYAKKNGFCKIVTPQWMHDSVKAGRLLDETKYFPSIDNNNNTPKQKKNSKSQKSNTNTPSQSAIKKKRKTPPRKPNRKQPDNDDIQDEEEHKYRPSSASQPKKLPIFKPISIPAHNNSNSSDAATIHPDASSSLLPPSIPISRPRSRESSRGSAGMRRPRPAPLPQSVSSLLLDSHVIYLSSCPPWNKKAHQPVQTKCFQLAATGGASVLPRITPLVNTIVIVSVPVAASELEKIRAAQTKGAKVVGIQWLQHCVEKNVVVSNSKFPPPPWDASANNENLNLNNGNGNSTSLQLREAGRSTSSLDILSTGFSFDENKAPNAPPSTYNFHGARVSLGPLALRDPGSVPGVASAIHSGRGKVLKHDASGFVESGVPTHVVCPVSLNESETAVINAIKNQNPKVLLMTKAWVIACIEEKALLPARTCILFRPIARVNCPDFKNYTVALTGFQHRDEDRNRWRCTLIELITLLGGTYNERMSKKTNILVADDSIHVSKKVMAAKNWEIPVVGYEWLFACASQGMNVHHSQHPFVAKKPKRKTPKKKSETSANENKMGRPPVPASTQAVASQATATQSNNATTPMPDSKAVSISLFKKFASSLQDMKDGSNSNGESGDGLGDSEALREAGAVKQTVEATARSGRSVSVSLEPHHDWSGSAEVMGSASQSQVIVHRDLTPPPSPIATRRTRRSMPPREAKAKRIKLGS